MSQWAFVVAAYAMVLTGLVALLGAAFRQCRQAEHKAERLGRRP